MAIAQIAPVLGDLRANLRKVRRFQKEARANGAELLIFPELAVTGYARGHVMARSALRRSDEEFVELLRLSEELPPAEGFEWFAGELLDRGVSEDEIVTMNRRNPAQLLGLE